MKVDHSHFPVFTAGDVPADTVAVPEPIFDATRIDDPPTVKEVLVAKADRARQLLEWATPYTCDAPDYA